MTGYRGKRMEEMTAQYAPHWLSKEETADVELAAYGEQIRSAASSFNTGFNSTGNAAAYKRLGTCLGAYHPWVDTPITAEEAFDELTKTADEPRDSSKQLFIDAFHDAADTEPEQHRPAKPISPETPDISPEPYRQPGDSD